MWYNFYEVIELRETIRDKNFRILGYIEHKPNGDKVVTTVTGKLMGYYRKSMNVTTNYTGSILARCDAVVCLLFDVNFW